MGPKRYRIVVAGELSGRFAPALAGDSAGSWPADKGLR